MPVAEVMTHDDVTVCHTNRSGTAAADTCDLPERLLKGAYVFHSTHIISDPLIALSRIMSRKHQPVWTRALVTSLADRIAATHSGQVQKDDDVGSLSNQVLSQF